MTECTVDEYSALGFKEISRCLYSYFNRDNSMSNRHALRRCEVTYNAQLSVGCTAGSDKSETEATEGGLSGLD